MPTYRTNALYQAPTVDNAVYEQFGMQPGMDRLNLLPRHDAKLGWIAPNALYQIARAIVSPSVAAQGGNVSPEDAVNFAGNVSLGSLGTSALVRNPAPGPGKMLPMAVKGKSPAFNWANVPVDEGYLYHGTPAKNLEGIKKYGLWSKERARNDYGNRHGEYSDEPPLENLLYFTKKTIGEWGGKDSVQLRVKEDAIPRGVSVDQDVLRKGEYFGTSKNDWNIDPENIEYFDTKTMQWKPLVD